MRRRFVQAVAGGALAGLLVVVGGAPIASAATASGPDCSRSSAKKAVLASGKFARAVKRDFYSRGKRLFQAWMIYKLHCRDLTGDGLVDMVVLLSTRPGPNSGAPPIPWAIFRNTGESYELGFSKPRFVGTRIELLGNVVQYIVPVYERRDPNCCPSTLLTRYVSWDGTRFVVGTTPPVGVMQAAASLMSTR